MTTISPVQRYADLRKEYREAGEPQSIFGPIFCDLYDYAAEVEQCLDDETVLTWVHQLNQLAERIDQAAVAIHPSAWPEMLRDDLDRWRALAQRGPRPRKRKTKSRAV